MGVDVQRSIRLGVVDEQVSTRTACQRVVAQPTKQRFVAAVADDGVGWRVAR
jgi:hypothetical protein